jgi:ribosomal protein S18 acetylase RimI-like enzyme
MNAAREYAKSNDYDRLELSTAKDNYIGQALYESLGYQRDDEFFHYSLDT